MAGFSTMLEAAALAEIPRILSTTDHRRDLLGLTYVYPVISRRAGGVSVGINLNPNNACNWACVYCQVPSLVRGSAPAIDLDQLEAELRMTLSEILHGNFMTERVPEGARRLNDIALSGNGEPTSAHEFAEVIALVGRILEEFALRGAIKVVLITNGSLVHRPAVQAGLAEMAGLQGEVWYKLDRATRTGIRATNGVEASPLKAVENLRLAASLCPTYLQTCMYALDGIPPAEGEVRAYLDLVREVVTQGVPLAGVLLYGLARPSLQPEAARLSALPAAWMQDLAARIEGCGLNVQLSL